MGISEAYAWKHDGAPGEYLPAALKRCMQTSHNQARNSDWILGLSHGVPLHVTVVKPNAMVRVADMDAWMGHVTRVVETVDSKCGAPGSTVAPRRPSSILFTVYLWAEKKRLPAKHGLAVGKEHCNTGMCTRYPSDGHCEILVFRKEDAIKTLIHEVLHAYHVGDWCNQDGAITTYASQIGARLRSPPHTQYRPAETVVDAVAMYLYHKMFDTDWDVLIRRSDVLRRRVLRHFRGAAWRQDSHALEYLVLRHALLAQPDAMRLAFAKGLQNPQRDVIRDAFLTYDARLLIHAAGRVTGASLCSTA